MCGIRNRAVPYSSACLLLLFVLLIASPVESTVIRAEITPVRLNKTIVLLPAPFGFTEASRRSKKIKQFSRMLTLPRKEFLALFIHKGDMRLIRSGKQPLMKQYLTVQISTAARQKRIVAGTFRQLRQKLRQQFASRRQQSVASGQKQIDRVTRKLREQAPQMQAIRVGTMRPVGILFDSRQAISYGVLVKYRTTIDDLPQEILMAGSVTYVMVKNKLINVYVFRVYKTGSDMQWVSKTTREWVDSIVRSN